MTLLRLDTGNARKAALLPRGPQHSSVRQGGVTTETPPRVPRGRPPERAGRGHYAAYRLLVDEGVAGNAPAVQAPEDFVARVVSAAGLPEAVARRALKMIREARDSRPDAITGRDPVGVAGAAVFVAAKLLGAGDNLTEHTMAEALGITEVTVRKDMRNLGYRLDADVHAWIKVSADGT